jgi:hypothetical protein
MRWPVELRKASVAFSIVLCAALLSAKKSNPATPDELAGITQRGRMLVEYTSVVARSMAAVTVLNPEAGAVTHWVARKNSDGWEVAFGRLNGQGDQFLVVYEAVETATVPPTVKTYEPPQVDDGFYLFAVKAINTARLDFHGENRPYNVAVLPADSSQFYVYVFPKETLPGVYPLGGDVRYLVSSDGSTIVEKRQLHKAILEMKSSGTPGRPVGGFHSHVLSDVPEDTDVFYVLTRRPAMPEFVATRSHVYEIQVDGSIRVQK